MARKRACKSLSRLCVRSVKWVCFNFSHCDPPPGSQDKYKEYNMFRRARCSGSPILSGGPARCWAVCQCLELSKGLEELVGRLE